MGGFFSNKKTTVVASTVYNLAGPEDSRENYLKTLVFGSVLSRDRTRSTADTLRNGLLYGPGMTLRSFGRWSRTQGYSASLGMAPGSLHLTQTLNHASLAALIPHASGETVMLQTAELGVADFTIWVDQHILLYYPELRGTAYTATFADATNTATITFEDTSTTSFVLSGYDRASRYLYASYNLALSESAGAVVPGDLVELEDEDSFPSLSGWTELEYSEQPYTMELTTTEQTRITYSDARPEENSETSSSTEEDYDDTYRDSERITYQGRVGDCSTSLREVMYQMVVGSKETTVTVTSSSETISGGVTKTTTVTTTTESRKTTRTYQIDQQELCNKDIQPLQLLIYKHGSGNAALDAFFTTSVTAGNFLPFIPLRLDNGFVSEEYFGDIHAQTKRALKKSIGTSLANIQGKIAESPDLGHMDYIYVTFGVPLNVQSNASKRYVYEFFQEIMLGQDLTGASYYAWEAAWDQADAEGSVWGTWWAAQSDEMDPLYGTEEPTRPTYPNVPWTSVRVASAARADINYDVIVSWAGMQESTGSGLKKPGAKKGDLWFETVGSTTFIQDAYFGGYVGGESGESYIYETIEHVRLNWQTGADSWRTLDIRGLRHQNMIYDGYSETISAAQALAASEESGFIIPLHEEVFRRMSLKDATQMSTASSYLVFNTYRIYKHRWYETGWFKFIVMAVIMIAAIYFGPGILAAAEGAGILGSHAAVGAALGFTGTAAIAAGMLANAVAGMVLSMVLKAVYTQIFGEKAAAILSAITSLIGTVGLSLMEGGVSLSQLFVELAKPENILRLTMAVGGGLAAYMQAGVQDVLKRNQELITSYDTLSQELAAKEKEFLGTGSWAVSPISLTDAGRLDMFETRDTFLSRTLLTGSEIAEMTMAMVSGFVDTTLDLSPPS